MFNVGDRVKVVRNIEDSSYDKYVGTEGVATEITEGEPSVEVQCYNNELLWWYTEELEAITRTRGFQAISTAENISLPQRKTKDSAGYDFECSEDVTLEPHKVTLVPTGVKAYMQSDEYLGLHIRSGLAVKHQLSLVNSQGIVDADYYNNSDNEGHIMFAIINHGDATVELKKGQRIGQGIFYKYLLVDNDGTIEERKGGFGSTL